MFRTAAGRLLASPAASLPCARAWTPAITTSGTSGWASAAEPAPVTPPQPEGNAAAYGKPSAQSLRPPQLGFNDPRLAFQTKSTGAIVRSLVVFRACRWRWLIAHADSLLAGSQAVFGSTLVNWLVRHTFYRQFVAGPDAEGIKPTLDRLRLAGVGAVLDYAAEDDVGSSHGSKSRKPPHSSVVARTYSYEDEAACDRRMGSFLKSIEAAQAADGRGFAAIKVTALGLPRLLERASAALQAIQELFRQFDADGNGYIDREEFVRQYAALFSDDSPDRMDHVFRYLDTDCDGRVDYLAFTKRVTVYDGAAIAGRSRQQGNFSKAALSQEELQLLDTMVKRVDTLAEVAAQAGVRLMVDAEHSYFQPAIDAVVAELQRRHNRVQPLVYGTYQCYLKDVHQRLALDMKRAHTEGYTFGCKLVRGAYMHLERRRAAHLGTPSPVWDTIQETHAAYDAAVAHVLSHVHQGGAELMVASHNQTSVERAVAGMAALGLPPQAPVHFGQLLGMADHLTFTLGAHGYGAYKYVPFGEVHEVMPYLIRRAQENGDVVGGVGREAAMLRAELLRRVLPWGQ